MLPGHILRNVYELGGNELETLFFEPRDYTAGQMSLHAVRLDNYQSAFCH